MRSPPQLLTTSSLAPSTPFANKLVPVIQTRTTVRGAHDRVMPRPRHCTAMANACAERLIALALLITLQDLPVDGQPCASADYSRFVASIWHANVAVDLLLFLLYSAAPYEAGSCALTGKACYMRTRIVALPSAAGNS